MQISKILRKAPNGAFSFNRKGEIMNKTIKRGITDLHDLMTINNTSIITVEVQLFTDGTIVETPCFCLDTGQNIGQYIEDILGYSFKYENVWLPVYSTMDTLSDVCNRLNEMYRYFFNTPDALISELMCDVTELDYELSI